MRIERITNRQTKRGAGLPMKSEKKHEQLRPRKKNIARKTKKLATPRKAKKAQSRASVKTPKSTGSGSSSATKKLNRKLPRKIKRISSKPRPKAKQAAPRNEAQYSAKSEKFKDSWDRVLTVVSKMRSEKVSLTKASQDVGISPRTVIRLGRSAFRKRKNGKYAAKAKDNLLRLVMVPTPEGTREIAVRGSEQVRLLAEY